MRLQCFLVIVLCCGAYTFPSMAAVAIAVTGPVPIWTTRHNGRSSHITLPFPISGVPEGTVLFEESYWAIRVSQVIVDGSPLAPEHLQLASETELDTFKAGSDGHIYLVDSHPVWTTDTAWAFVFETGPMKADRYLIPRQSLEVHIKYQVVFKNRGESGPHMIRSRNLREQDVR